MRAADVMKATDERRGVGRRGRGRSLHRRGFLIVVVLVIITLLALLGAAFTYYTGAQAAAARAAKDNQQARLAAWSAIDRTLLLLRQSRADVTKWYDNRLVFRRMLIQADDKEGGSESLADQQKIEGRNAWRASVVAYQRQGINEENVRTRFGLIDEASKINLNAMLTVPGGRRQLIALFDQVPHENVTSEELADALLDWMDPDDDPRPSGAEDNYYSTRNPPHRAKNRYLESVEELLMIRGFDGFLLYGEDYNRNGRLDANENDGPDGAFPPDDGDGKLNRGILPFITVYSWDFNASNDNKQRVNLNQANFSRPETLPLHIQEEVRPEILQFIAEVKTKRRTPFRSVGELLGLEVYENGSSNYDRVWRRFDRANREQVEENPDSQPGEGDEDGDGDGGGNGGGGNNGGQNGNNNGNDNGGRGGRGGRGNNNDNDGGGRGGNAGRGGNNNGGGNNGGNNNDDDEDKDDRRSGLRNQSIRDDGGNAGGGRGGGRRGGGNAGGGRGNDGGGNFGGNDGGDDGDDGGRGDRGGRRGNAGGRDGNNGGGRDANRGGGRRGTGRDGNRPGRIALPRGDNDDDEDGDLQPQGPPIPNPITPQDMPILMDRFTTSPQPALADQINVNTAEREVLLTLPGLDENQVDAIIATRSQLQEADLATPAWLVTSGVVDPETFVVISNRLTTRSLQFTVDAIGFADHVGAAKRIQAVVEMYGEIPKIKYYRDITSLGIGYDVWNDQEEEGSGFGSR